MTLWESLTQVFQRDAAHLDRPLVPTDHITPPLVNTASLPAGEGYFQVWVVQMFLKHDRAWFKSWYPVVQSLTRLRVGSLPDPVEIAHLAGPSYLRELGPRHLDRVIQLDMPLTPLLPFNGGTVQIEVGLVAMQASDLMKSFLDVISSFTGLLMAPQFSSALNITSIVSKSVDQLLGVGEQHMILGYQRTFESAGGGGNADLRPAYIVLINAPRGTYEATQLWIKDGSLLHGATLSVATELAGVDYVMLRIETRSHRDDWDALHTISEPFANAIHALMQAAANDNASYADADVFIRTAVAAALTSPDLAIRDRTQVARAIRDRYQEYRAALLGERSLEVASPPTLADVALSAQQLDASPITVGQLFAE
jgi:hypothetical protein